MKAQFDTMRAYYYAIPDDDILKGFRARAGQRARGQDLGGWYSGEPARRFWWSNGDTFNAFGQWLSGMARMSKATGDAEMRSKAIFLMGEWASTIEPDGWFFYSRRPWQPHYIYDKQVGGLVDMAVYAGRKDALVHLSKITDWAIENLDRSRKVDSDTEWYTLSENLYRAYQVTGDEKYRRFADLWRFDDYWNAFSGAAPTEVKRHGHHAYSHVNTMSSCAMAHVVSGEKKYLDAIRAEYDWLQKTQCYASGGYGPEEDLVPEDGELGRRLETTAYSFETTCGAWGGFKLARYLLTLTGEARYGDWIEKLLYNGSLAALPMGPKGATFYYSDYRLGGGRKFYHPDGNWPCCSGTYPQVLADYHNVVYFRDAGGLAVNLFVPSRAAWNQNGTQVVVEQETTFPETDTTTLTVRPGKSAAFDVKFRVPGMDGGAGRRGLRQREALSRGGGAGNLGRSAANLERRGPRHDPPADASRARADRRPAPEARGRDVRPRRARPRRHAAARVAGRSHGMDGRAARSRVRGAGSAGRTSSCPSTKSERTCRTTCTSISQS